MFCLDATPIYIVYTSNVTISSEAEVPHGVCMPVEGGDHDLAVSPGKVVPAE